MKKYFLTTLLIYFLPILLIANETITDPYYKNYKQLTTPICFKENTHYYTSFQLFLAEAKMYGLEYAINNAASNADVNGNLENLDFHFKLGGQLALGYLFDYDNWDLRVIGSIYYSSVSDKSQRSIQSETAYGDSFVSRGLIPIWYHPSAYNNISYNRIRFSDAEADWDFDFYNTELDLGKVFKVGEKVVLRPSFGLKSIFTYQKYKVEYLNGKTFYSDITTSYKPENSIINLKNNSLGIGPKVGIESSWFIQKHIKLIFNASGALLHTFFRAARQETADYTTTAENPMPPGNPIITLHRENFNNRNSFHSYNPYAGITIGLGWEKCFTKKNQVPLRVSLDCSYFLENFWKINQLVKFNDAFTDSTYNSDNTDLQMQGAALGFSLLF